MKKAIELADATFRAYKKKSGATSLHLRTWLIVYADADFRTKIQNARPSLNLNEPTKPSGLSAFMKEFPRCYLQLPNKRRQECEVSYSCYPAARSIQRPAGGHWITLERQDIADEECTLFYFWVATIIRDGNIFGEGLADVLIAGMKLIFHINFPGRAPNEKIVIRRKVPIIRRGRGW